MRLEQLVLYGPGEDDRVRFSHGLTVFAGLGPDQRADLIQTMVDALTGRLSNASVIYTDKEGRRIFADRNGATYAATGTRAPAPTDLLGHDPAGIASLICVTESDLGLGQRVTAEDVAEALASARAELDRCQVEHRDVTERAEALAGWQAEADELSRRILDSDDDRARWAWFERNAVREKLVAELAAFDDAINDARDHRVLQAVDALREAGAEWTDAATATAQLNATLGPVPAVAAADLDRVATTPDILPADLDGRLDAWHKAADLLAGATADLAAAHEAPAAPEDALVGAFSAMDQERLWPCHAALVEANERYQEASSRFGNHALDPQDEEEIESAHLEVVRCQREVERRFRPGILASATLAVSALLAGSTVSIALGVVTLAAAIGLGWWLLAIPRRNLAAATLAEEVALGQADAGTWLGLHLRRLDAFTDGDERRQIEAAMDGRATAQLNWDDVAGSLSPEDLTARAEAVRDHAEAISPKAGARRRDQAKARHAAAVRDEAAAQQGLFRDLDPYGLPPGSNVAPQRLAAVLDQRVAAGRVARDARELARLTEREAEARRRLDQLLGRLGEPSGPLEERLERAIVAVTSARSRKEEGRDRDAVATELLEIEHELRTELRPNWRGRPAPTAPPVDPDLLHARRSDVSALISAAGLVDLVAAEHRLDAAEAKVDELEQRLEELAQGPTSPQQHLIARLGRTIWIDGQEDTIPLVLDDPLVSSPTGERMELLDQLVRLASHVQIVLLTADPVATRWARDRCRTGRVLLYESTEQPTTPTAPASASRPRSGPIESVPFPSGRSSDRALLS